MGGRAPSNFQLLIDWTTVKDLHMTGNGEQSCFFVPVGNRSLPAEQAIFSAQSRLPTAPVGNALALEISQAAVTPPAAHHKWSDTSRAHPCPPLPGAPAKPGRASPASSLLDALPRLHLPPEAVPQPSSKPAFLHAQEDAGRLHHQDEGEEPGRAHGSWARQGGGAAPRAPGAPQRGGRAAPLARGGWRGVFTKPGLAAQAQAGLMPPRHPAPPPQMPGPHHPRPNPSVPQCLLL